MIKGKGATTTTTTTTTEGGKNRCNDGSNNNGTVNGAVNGTVNNNKREREPMQRQQHANPPLAHLDVTLEGSDLGEKRGVRASLLAVQFRHSPQLRLQGWPPHKGADGQGNNRNQGGQEQAPRFTRRTNENPNKVQGSQEEPTRTRTSSKVYKGNQGEPEQGPRFTRGTKGNSNKVTTTA